MVYLARHFGLPEVANFWEEVIHLNIWHQHRISKLIVEKLFGTISGKRIAILGFAFKANTNDTRESAAIQICKDLIEEGANLIIHDPKVESSQISKDLGFNETKIESVNKKMSQNINENGGWIMTKNIYEGFKNADAILILTEWSEYSEINWIKAAQLMRTPSWLFDARSIANHEDVSKTNLNFWRIGDGY